MEYVLSMGIISNNKSKIVFALTGGTGLLGSNLLFEIIKNNLENLDNIKIFFLARNEEFMFKSLGERIREILLKDGVYYLGIDPEYTSIIEKILNCIIPIPFELTKTNLGISEQSYSQMKEEKIDYFFHSAALTDFRDNLDVQMKLDEINIIGTLRVINLIDCLNVDEIINISSAYVCGDKDRIVQPNEIDFDAKFRNPYEKSKLKAEIFFRRYVELKRIKYRVFRPTTICGRMLEPIIGSTTKFDVFYAWAAFFLRIKLKLLGSFDKIYEKPLEIPIRVQVNKSSGLNIIPVDYAAKIIYQVVLSKHPDNDFHIAFPYDLPHIEYIKFIFENLNIQGLEFVEKEPENKTKLEKIYYKTVGKIFTPYIIGKPCEFNTQNIVGIYEKLGMLNLIMGKKEFSGLLEYAQKKHYLIDLKDA